MSSNAGHRSYDENLLASAPKATKAQLQSGYNPDLLLEKATPPRSRPSTGNNAGGNSPVEQADHEPMPPKVPFYRTRKGIIIIVVVAIVVIVAAAVGGGVGGKHKKKQTNIAQQGAGASTEGGATSTPTTGHSQITHGTTTTPSPATATTSPPAQGAGNTVTNVIGSSFISLPPITGSH